MESTVLKMHKERGNSNHTRYDKDYLPKLHACGIGRNLRIVHGEGPVHDVGRGYTFVAVKNKTILTLYAVFKRVAYLAFVVALLACPCDCVSIKPKGAVANAKRPVPGQKHLVAMK